MVLITRLSECKSLCALHYIDIVLQRILVPRQDLHTKLATLQRKGSLDDPFLTDMRHLFVLRQNLVRCHYRFSFCQEPIHHHGVHMIRMVMRQEQNVALTY